MRLTDGALGIMINHYYVDKLMHDLISEHKDKAEEKKGKKHIYVINKKSS